MRSSSPGPCWPRGAGRAASSSALVVPVLGALVATQTVTREHDLVLDARLPAVLVAAVLLWLRAPLVAVVLAAGATAAVLRLLGVD